MWLFLLFIAIPLIEIGLFIQVGGLIGLWPTLFIVLATAVLGSYLVRQQGAHALGQVKDSFNRLSDPSEPLAHGAMILFSGALLLTPGFFTDTMGFLLLIPAFRRWTFKQLKSRVRVQSGFTVHQTGSFGAGGFPGANHPGRDDVIDGDFEDVTPDKKPNHPGVQGPSGWTKH